MRSKKLLTLVLALCLLLTVIAPAATAVEISGSSTVSGNKAPATGTVSGTQNGLLASGNAQGINSLRDQLGEVKVEYVDGQWVATSTDKNISVPLKDTELPEHIQKLKEAADYYSTTDRVSAFVVLEDAPLAEQYSSIVDVPADESALLTQQQNALIDRIEEDVLAGSELDVVTQFTYLTNSVVVDTEFGNLEAIAAVPGVKSVFLSPVYYPCTTDTTMDPYTVSSGVMTNVPDVWADGLGYTGAGMTIAVLDTGLDLDHPSFEADPLLGETSWDVAYLESMLGQLNASERYSETTGETLTAEDLYYSAKVPFTFNYATGTTNVLHNDGAGDHGSHVAGIAAANKVEGTGVVGMAPDAQIIVMKVFEPRGGAKLENILSALEDAMRLGCDVANLSLGSAAGFSSTDIDEIDDIYERIAESDIIVDIAAGNEGTSSAGDLHGNGMNTTDNIDNSTISSPATYANAMAVGSVENTVTYWMYFDLADGSDVFYMPSVEYLYEYTSVGLEMLAGQELEYVFVPGLGAAEDFYDVDGNSIVEGKVAVVKRGDLSFSDKAYNAQDAGAVACLIWDSVSEDIFSFGMTTEGAQGIPYIPVALISLEDGQKMADAENKTLIPTEELGPRVSSYGGQMSSFSSWGVSPDLRLLPDISGVGGNVYSCYDGGQYGLMSGTSMATPQVAGITALVLQYLRETFPEASEAEIRVLVDSLVMSTAVPVVDNTSGVEASPRQQGAGLINALYAVTSEAYLTVSGSDRPKAELFDSADGKYTFTFTVHNFGAEEKTYTLSSSLLCEDYAEDPNWPGLYFMAGTEHALDSSAVTFSAESVTVAPNGSVDVTVTIDLTETDKEWIDEYFANGNYVEGFVYLDSAEGVDLSLPFLGFYGDWTDAPVFDTGWWYDNGFWQGVVDGVNITAPEANEFYHVFWTSLGGNDWVLGFNPYGDEMVDANGDMIYDPAYNVLSPNGDGVIDNFTEIYLSLMRNAKHLVFTYTDEAGNVLDELSVDYVSKTMYLSNYGSTYPFVYSDADPYLEYLYDFTDADGNVLPSGTKLTLTVSGILDYGDEEVSDTISIPVLIDTEAPKIVGELVESSADGRNYLTFTVSDDSLAYVALMNPAGTRVYSDYDDSDFVKNADGTYTVTVDVTGYGNELLVALCDYGTNEGFYEVTYETENKPEVDWDALYGYRVADNEIYDDSLFGWITLDKETAEVERETNDMYEYYAINAAEYAGGYVFAVDAGYNFLYMEPGLWNRNFICNIGLNVVDMAFDDTTDTMYLTTKTTGEDGYSTVCALYTVDLLTGELEQVHTYRSQYEMPWAMTFVNGELYAIKYYYAGLFKVNMETFALEAVKDADGNDFKPVTSTGKNTSANYAQSMTYSQADGKLYWAYYNSSWSGVTSELFVIDVETLEYTATPFPVGAEVVGLLTLEEKDYELPASDEVTKLVMSDESLILKEGDSYKLSVTALPWNAPGGEITWSSSDESVATVKNGVVTGISAGQTVVTATHGDVSASCIVNVVRIEGTLYAYNYFNGTGYFGDWQAIDLNTMETESLYMSPVDFVSADYNGHDGNIYGYDAYGQCWRFNPTTGEVTALGAPLKVIPMDLAYDYSTGFMYAVTIDEMNGMSTIHYVNMSNGSLVKVADVYGLFLLTLACDTEGVLYAMNSDGTLFWLYMYEMDMGGGGWMPLAEGEGTVTMMVEPMYIMDGFGGLMLQQSMCFDHNSRKLIWACPEVGTIYWIDIYAAEPYAVSLGDPTGSGMLEYMGLYTIPEEIPALAYAPVERIEAEDMMLLEGGKKLPAATVYPLNATNQTITWSSADESVAYVNENGLVVGVKEGSTTLTGTLVDGENTLEVTINVTVKASVGNLYGYVLTDMATMGGFVWAEIPDTDPSNPYYAVASDYQIFAQEYVNGKVYAYGVDSMDWEANWQFMTINPETYEIESSVDMGDGFPFVYDMTYDYTTGTMYAVVGYDTSATDVYMINMDNGKLLPVMSTEPLFMSIAAAPDGSLYAMAVSEEYFDYETWQSGLTGAVLYKLDVENGTYEPVYDTGVTSDSIASMTIDQDTGYLYWAALCQMDGTNGLYLVDIEKQETYALGAIGALGSQVAGLYVIADNYPETPTTLTSAALTSTMEDLLVGDTVDLEVFAQPSGLDVQVTWSSDDESVATVDENGTVTAVGAGVTTVTATVTYEGKTITVTCAIVVYSPDAHFLSYNVSNHGWAYISQMDVSVVTDVSTDVEELSPVQSAVLVDGVIYGYDEDNKFFKTSEENGFVREYLGECDVELMPTEDDAYPIFEIRDLAYDPVNGRLLAIGTHSEVTYEYGDSIELYSGSRIYEVDPTNGHMTEVITLYFDADMAAQNLYGLTVTADGTVYVFESYDDYICSVDMETGLLNKLNATFRQGVYGGSDGEPMALEYDPVSGDLYLLMTSNGKFYTMFKFDTDSNALTNLGRVGEVVLNGWAYEGDAFAGLLIDAAHTHAWSETVYPATCTEDGHKDRECLLCGETATEVIPATGHTWDEGEVTTEPTCTEKGEKTYTCSVCGETKTEEVAATGHSYVNGVCEHCGVGEPDPSNPKDGDNTMLGVAIAAAVVSAMSIVALPIAKKKLF